MSKDATRRPAVSAVAGAGQSQPGMHAHHSQKNCAYEEGGDKRIEQERYSLRSTKAIREKAKIFDSPYGAAAIRPTLRRPYLVYEDHIRRVVRPGMKVHDLCCGDGLHSLTGAQAGGEVYCSDIAAPSLVLAKMRAAREGIPIETICADYEALPFAPGFFNVTTCAGSLSYCNLERFLSEVTRVLKPDGALVLVDSFNHNPIYRFNRFLGFLRGRRTRMTLEQMPSERTISRLREVFSSVEVSYHGIFSFLIPLLVPLWGEPRAAIFLGQLDNRFGSWRRMAFKIVIVAHGVRQDGVPIGN